MLLTAKPSTLTEAHAKVHCHVNAAVVISLPLSMKDIMADMGTLSRHQDTLKKATEAFADAIVKHYPQASVVTEMQYERPHGGTRWGWRTIVRRMFR